MQKKLIAAAVAGSLAVPAAAMAQDAGVTPYLRINNALSIVDTDGADTTFDLRNVSSRFGLRASADVGNGTTVYGQYEFATNTDIEGSGVADTRIGKVGLRGSFGSLEAGNQWGAFYNFVGVNLDPTYSLGAPVYATFAGGPYRTSNTISYANSFGPVSLAVDTRVSTDSPPAANVESGGGADTGEDLDGFGVAGTFTLTDMFDVDVAYDVTNNGAPDDLTRLGASLNASMGSFWGSLAYMDVSQDAGAGVAETDNQAIAVFVGNAFTDNTSGWVGYQTAENVANQDAEAILFHLNHKLGGGPLRLWYEGAIYDQDGAADSNQHLLGLRIDM